MPVSRRAVLKTLLASSVGVVGGLGAYGYVYGRHELGVTRDRSEAELVAAELGQPAEEILDIRLVTGALPAEHVRVEDDEALHATASS